MRVTGLHPHKKQLQKTAGYYSEFIDPFDSLILAFLTPPPPTRFLLWNHGKGLGQCIHSFLDTVWSFLNKGKWISCSIQLNILDIL